MTRREQIIEILRPLQYNSGEKKLHKDNEINMIADEILALPLNVPSNEEIINIVSLNTVVSRNDREIYGTHFGVGEDNREIYDECIKMTQWVRDEIIRRNVSNYKDDTIKK